MKDKEFTKKAIFLAVVVNLIFVLFVIIFSGNKHALTDAPGAFFFLEYFVMAGIIFFAIAFLPIFFLDRTGLLFFSLFAGLGLVIIGGAFAFYWHGLEIIYWAVIPLMVFLASANIFFKENGTERTD